MTPACEAILPYLRSQDAGQRAAAIESLQALPEAIAPFMAPLLGDRDSDVRTACDGTGPQHEGPDATRAAVRTDRK